MFAMPTGRPPADRFRKEMEKKKQYGAPSVLLVLRVQQGKGFCAGSDVLDGVELESAGIETEEFDFSAESDGFNFTWEETL